MSDGIQVTPGSGVTVATDQCTINGVDMQVPRGKTGFGADGEYADVSAATPMPSGLNVGTAPTGASTPYRNVGLGTNGQSAKTSAGRLYSLGLFNAGLVTVYVKVYDKASAPTDADTPVLTIPVPAGLANGRGYSTGLKFANGIAFRATTGVADNDANAPGANEVILDAAYA